MAALKEGRLAMEAIEGGRRLYWRTDLMKKLYF